MPADLPQQVYTLVKTLGIGQAAATLAAPPAQVRTLVADLGPVYSPARRWDQPAARAAFTLAAEIGTNQAAARLGTTPTRLRAVWDRWELGRPNLTTTTLASPIDQAAARHALTLARAQGVKAAAAVYRTSKQRLYRVWDRYHLGRPSDTTRTRGAWPSPSWVYTDQATAQQALTLARAEGNRAAMRAYQVGETTLYRAWDRWELGRPTDDPEAAARAQARAAEVMGRLIAGAWAEARALHARRHTHTTRPPTRVHTARPPGMAPGRPHRATSPGTARPPVARKGWVP